jgi:hypothetical protein
VCRPIEPSEISGNIIFGQTVRPNRLVGCAPPASYLPKTKQVNQKVGIPMAPSQNPSLHRATGGDTGLQVRVKLLSGNEMIVSLAVDDTVQTLKGKVAVHTGIDVTDFKLRDAHTPHCKLTTRVADLAQPVTVCKTVKFEARKRSLLRFKKGEIGYSKEHAEYVCKHLAQVGSAVAKTEKNTTEILTLLQNPGTAVGDENLENMTDADLQNIRSVADVSRVNTIARMQKAKAEQDRRKTLQKEDAAKARLANLSAATIAQLDAAGGVVKKAKELAVAEADKKKEEAKKAKALAVAEADKKKEEAKKAKSDAQEEKKRKAEDHMKKHT